MSTPTPAAPSGKSTGAQTPEWQLDQSCEEVFLIRNGPTFKGSQAGIFFCSREFTIAEIRNAVQALNQHAALLTANARLGQENAKLRETLEWYSDKVAGIISSGDREELEEDQGQRARTALRPADSPQVKVKS